MSEERKPSGVPWIAGVVLVLALYVGAYYATVEPIPIPKSDADDRIFVGEIRAFYPAWIAFGITPNGIFGAAHWLDRRRFAEPRCVQHWPVMRAQICPLRRAAFDALSAHGG